MVVMAVLRNHRGDIITDAKGQQIKVGTTVTDDMFGDGIARGTVAQEKGEGVNILVDWLGPGSHDKPKSRGAGPDGKWRTSLQSSTTASSAAASICVGRSTAGSSARSQTQLRMPPPASSKSSNYRIMWADGPCSLFSLGHKGPAKLAVANRTATAPTLPTTHG